MILDGEIKTSNDAFVFINRKKNSGENPTAEEQAIDTSPGSGIPNLPYSQNSPNDSTQMQNQEVDDNGNPVDDGKGGSPSKKSNMLLYGGLAVGGALTIAALAGAFKSRSKSVGRTMSGVKRSTQVSI